MHIRHYSLSDSPGKDYYRISVKREEAHGDAPSGIVSNYLHKQLQVGDMLQFSAPAGDFELDNTELPIVLISGGIGITPLLSMLNTIIEKQPQRQVTFIHATGNSQTHAFKDHLQQIVNEHQHIKSYVVYGAPTEADRTSGHFDKEGYVGLDFLQSIVPSKEANFYFCGPIPFMEAINEALNKWSVSKDHIHYEVFSPLAILGEK